MKQIFVYGTLMSTGSNPATEYVGAEVIGRGWIVGYLYDLGWYPGYRPEFRVDDQGDAPKVWGELVSVPDDKMGKLDDYEGYPYLYDRQPVFVHTDNGIEQAEVYVFNHTDALSEANRLPSGDWRLREGPEA